MRRSNSNLANNNFLKLILILKLLNIYYWYMEKLYSKSKGHNKVSKKSSYEHINTGQFTKCVKDTDKDEKNNHLKSDLKNLQLKVPVIISEKIVSIPLEHNIELTDYILGVKRIKNHVDLTDCKVFPLMLSNNKINLSEGKVFIEGVVKSTIEYDAVDDIGNSFVSGYMRHTTSLIPFRCVTLVSYSHLPIVEYDNKQNEVNEINCFLKQAEIFVSNRYSNVKSIGNINDLGKMFKAIHQKLVLKLTICLLQKQEVTITKYNN